MKERHHTTERTTRGLQPQCQELGMAVKKGLLFFTLTTGQEGVSYVGSFRMYY